MGVTILHCGKCDDCTHEDNFNSCILCDEKCDVCNDCDGNYFMEITTRHNRLICDNCIINSKNFKKDDVDHLLEEYKITFKLLSQKLELEYVRRNPILNVDDEIKLIKKDIQALKESLKEKKELLHFKKEELEQKKDK